MRKLETTCQVVSFSMLKGFWHVHNVFSQKQVSGFEFPLHPTASHKAHANPLCFSKDNTTVAFELGPHSY